MKICIRAHDLGVKGSQAILSELNRLGIDGVQMVCYKAYEDVAYAPGGITADKAAAIGHAFSGAGKMIPLVGAYFNPVHSDEAKRQRCFAVFAEYLKYGQLMGCNIVGSETGSFNDDKWTYHPQNRTEAALQTVVETFSHLADIAAECGSMVALEGAAGHVCYDVATLARAREMIGRPTKVIFDLYNYLDGDNQSQYLHILEQGLDTFEGQILLFHMKDCCFVPGDKPKQVPFGTGQMDLEAVLSRIKQYDRNAVLTLEGTTGAHIAAAVTTMKEIWERV